MNAEKHGFLYLFLPKIPSERNSVHPSEALATNGLPRLAETCPT